MSRTITLLALALIAHVTLVAALAHACGPNCGKYQNSQTNQLGRSPFQLGNRPNPANKNALSVIAEPTQRLQPAMTQTIANKSQGQLTEHPSDLPTNDPPAVAPK